MPPKDGPALASSGTYENTREREKTGSLHTDDENFSLGIERHFAPKYPVDTFYLHQVNLLPQMRPSLIEGDQEDLKNSIRKEGVLNRPIYATLDEQHAQEYLDVINKTWDKSIDLSELTPSQNGGYIVVVAGHRRTAAMQSICKEDGLDTQKVTVEAQSLQNPDPYTVLCLQLAENVFVPPSPERYAKIIYESFMLGLASGIYESKADFKRQMPMGETMVDNALRYMTLPISVQRQVEGGKLPYSHAYVIARIIKPYENFLQENPAFIRNGFLLNEAVELKLHLMINEKISNKWSGKKLNDVVSAEILKLSGATDDAVQMFQRSQDQEAAELRNHEDNKVLNNLSEAEGHVIHAKDIVASVPNYLKDATAEKRRQVCERLQQLELLARAVITELCE